MAWYCAESVRYRGRVVVVTFRYDRYQCAEVRLGRPLRLTYRDVMRIKRLLRRQGKAFGARCNHGCGGPPPLPYD